MPSLHVVSTSPLIIHGANFGNMLSPMKEIAPYLERRPAAFLISLTWSLREEGKFQKFRDLYFALQRKYPHIETVILASEPQELDMLRAARIPSVLCSHNCLIDENRFRVLDRDKKYKAVLNARMSAYKRIELARDVDNTVLVTYVMTPEDREYEKSVYGHMPHMDFVQYEGGRWNKLLSGEEVAEIYGQSRCGAILSAVEGACFASMEYLLCGLPVVTTPNRGGRDQFFHRDYAVWAEPDRESVAKAVERAVSLDISPEEIRARALARIEEHRAVYLELLRGIAARAGQNKSFVWKDFAVNQMHFKFATDKAALAYLAERGVSTRFSLERTLHVRHRQVKDWLREVLGIQARDDDRRQKN